MAEPEKGQPYKLIAFILAVAFIGAVASTSQCRGGEFTGVVAAADEGEDITGIVGGEDVPINVPVKLYWKVYKKPSGFWDIRPVSEDDGDCCYQSKSYAKLMARHMNEPHAPAAQTRGIYNVELCGPDGCVPVGPWDHLPAPGAVNGDCHIVPFGAFPSSAPYVGGSKVGFPHPGTFRPARAGGLFGGRVFGGGGGFRGAANCGPRG